MENNPTYYIDLFTKHLAGEATGKETLLLNDLINSDKNIKSLFEEYKKTWDVIEKSKINSRINIEDEWNTLQSRIKGGNRMIKKEAVVLPFNPEKRIKKRTNLPFLRIAAAILILVFCSIVFYRNLNNDEPKVIYAALNAVENKLPDGTSVILNTGSSIVYPEKFKNKTREVKLEGEAYFKVAHDVTKPFVITAEDVRIEVLGTSFYVNTSALNKNIEVILNTGKVAIYFNEKPSERIILQPGEKAVVSKSEKIISKMVNDENNYLAWKTKKIVFINDPLNEIIKTLNKVYHSNINITNESLSDCRITATFDNQSLESVLEVLKATVNIKVVKTGSRFEVSGNCAKN